MTRLPFLLVLALSALPACNDEDDTDDSGPEGDTDTDADADIGPGDLLWVTTGGGATEEDGFYNAVGAGDGVIIASGNWSSEGTFGEGTAGEVEVTAVGGVDAIFLGLDEADGSILWHLQVGGEGGAAVWNMPSTGLPDGGAAVLLLLGGPTTIGPAFPDALYLDVALLLLAPDGTVDASTILLRGGGSTLPYFADASRPVLNPAPGGGFLVSGCFEGSLTLLPGTAGEQTLVQTEGTLTDSYLAWLGADLGIERVWQLSAPEGYVVGTGVATDDGGALVQGSFSGSLTLGQTAPVTLTAAGPDPEDDPEDGDAYVALLDADGEPRWALSMGTAAGGGGADARAAVFTADGGVVVGGLYWGEGGVDNVLTVPGLDGVELVGDENDWGAMFLLGLDADGAPRWLQGVQSPGWDLPFEVDAFDDGAVAVSGFLYGQAAADVVFSDGETVPVEAWSSFLARYEADGTRAWTQMVGSSLAFSVDVLSDQSVVQAGYFLPLAVFGAGETHETTPLSQGYEDAAVALYAP